jgi:pilus assembly protein CpaB
MIRRLIAALAALLLAGVGAVLLLGYVAAADRRAMAGMETVEVLVVTEPVAEGTPVEKLAAVVAAKTLPVKAVAPGTLSSLEPVAGHVATTDLLPGEPLLGDRFADPASLIEAGTVQVPRGMQEVTLALEPHRVVGGEVTPKATVGVFVSLPKEEERPAQTKLVLHKVLVTRVQGGPTPASAEGGTDSGGSAVSGAPTELLTVTLAVKAPDAELVVFGAEHGKIWLSLEPAAATEKGSRVVTDEEVYQ